MIRFQGTITARAPITVSYPEHVGLPRTPHGEVVLHGGTFRGPLRKAAYHAVRDHLARARGVSPSEVFTLADAYMLGQGVDVTRSVNSESQKYAQPVAEATLRRLNPFLNLFGRWRLPSRLSVGEARTATANVMISGRGARTDMFERDTTEVEYLTGDDRDLLLRQITSAQAASADVKELNAEKQRLGKSYGTAENDGERRRLGKALEDIKARIATRKKETEGADSSIKHPLAGFEAIAPGSELCHTMTLVNGTSTDLGLLLLALSHLARTPFIGGHRAAGCGEFSAVWDVLEWPVGLLHPQSRGCIAITPEGVHMDGGMLDEALETFIAGIDDFDFSVQTLAQAKDRGS